MDEHGLRLFPSPGRDGVFQVLQANAQPRRLHPHKQFLQRTGVGARRPPAAGGGREHGVSDPCDTLPARRCGTRGLWRSSARDARSINPKSWKSYGPDDISDETRQRHREFVRALRTKSDRCICRRNPRLASQ
jgi:hypothetical protein